MDDVDACMLVHIPKKAMTAYKAYKAQTAAQDLITDAYPILIGIFLAVMVNNLLFTCWYHHSYKKWAAREKMIAEAEKPAIEGEVPAMMVPQQ